MRNLVTFAFLVSLAAGLRAQEPKPNPAPPVAGQGAVLHRAIEMYEAKRYGTALAAFHEAAAAAMWRPWRTWV